MNYGIYKSARNASWQCLIDCGIAELPIRPVQIAAHFGIHCKQAKKSELNGVSGEIRAIDDEVYISFDAEEPKARQRYTIMHELGHYLLGHLGATLLSRSESECHPEEEQAAERFAIDILAPACVLWGLSLHSAADIAAVCNISMQSAAIRAERMEMLYQRNMFLTHPLERQVYKNFEFFVKSAQINLH